jgi:hypothetical protein
MEEKVHGLLHTLGPSARDLNPLLADAHVEEDGRRHTIADRTIVVAAADLLANLAVVDVALFIGTSEARATIRSADPLIA